MQDSATNSSIDPHQLERLLTYCTDFAKQMLVQCGEFYPFGAVIKKGGEFSAVGGYTGEELPPRQEVYLFLQGAFTADFAKGNLEAAALAVDVKIPQQYHPPHPDGIRVLIECEGYARLFYIPYSVTKPGFLGRLANRRGTVACGEIITVDVTPSLTQNTGKTAGTAGGKPDDSVG